MTAGWCVRVSVFDDLVVSISERELAGRDLSEADADLIRDCAQHLLSFVGPKKPRVCACPGYDAVKGPYPSGFCRDCGDWFPGKGREQPPSINAVDPVDGIVAPGPTRAT